MKGFVGTKARKRRRNFFLLIIIIILVLIFYYFIPNLNNQSANLFPEDKILPDLSKDFSSLSDNVENLELIVFQKDQKIKFRDGQLNKTKFELKKTKEELEIIKKQFDTIKKEKDELISKSIKNENLTESKDFDLLKNQFSNLDKKNNKNKKIINDLKIQLDNLEEKLRNNKDIVLELSNENNILMQDLNLSFSKNKILTDTVNELNKKIENQIKAINKLKDISHHNR
tara:strand:- start:1344 stop:2027 length:684 start_codon:yes stop_codon:yes gene_type:complete